MLDVSITYGKANNTCDRFTVSYSSEKKVSITYGKANFQRYLFAGTGEK